MIVVISHRTRVRSRAARREFVEHGVGLLEQVEVTIDGPLALLESRLEAIGRVRTRRRAGRVRVARSGDGEHVECVHVDELLHGAITVQRRHVKVHETRVERKHELQRAHEVGQPAWQVACHDHERILQLTVRFRSQFRVYKLVWTFFLK